MNDQPTGRERHDSLLEQVRLGFPSPVSDPVHDAYVGFTIMKVFDRLDEMKGTAPYLGEVGTNDYDRARQAALDPGMRSIEEVIDLLMPYLNGCDLWAHPLQQMNVIPPVSVPALVANFLAGMLNPNLGWDEYSRKFSEVEVEVSALVSEMVGYDQSRAMGISTYGGSGAMLYGVKLMVAKALPGSSENGVREDVKVVVSDVSHSCKYTALDWLGIGHKNIVTVPTDGDNGILLQELDEAVHQILDGGEKLGGFVCTMGTTDAFGIDDIGFVAALRDQVVQEYGLDYPPHIHADAVIGWPYTVFNDHDFDGNPLGLSPPTIRSLRDTYLNIRNICLADSIGIDFHKTGYAQYISTLFLLKEKDDLDYITRAKEKMPCLFQAGEYHPGLYTLELSRAASGMFSALANLRFLGKDGFRVLLSHPVEMANILRERLREEEATAVLNRYNHGAVTLFRIYPQGLDANEQYERESLDPAYADDVEKHNEFNRRVYFKIREESRQGRCAALSFTDSYRTSPGGPPIAALKSFIMTPFVTRETVGQLMDMVLKFKGEAESA